MRWLLTLLVWVITVAVLAPVCFIVTMVLAGPHSSILPSWLQPLVLALGWIAFPRRSGARRSRGLEVACPAS